MAKKSAAAKSNPNKTRRRNPPPLTRDVGAQSRGPRLQRLRAVLLLIETAVGYPDINGSAAVEFLGDVSLTTADAASTQTYVEEDKNYDASVQFSMNSEQVLNSLVAACDLWIKNGCSKTLRFGFYTPNNYTNEKNTERSKRLGIQWPDGPMLKFLSEGALHRDEVLRAAKLSVIGEYEDQWKAHGKPKSGAGTGPLANLQMIKKWGDLQWRDSFGQIQWKFGEDDAESIEPTIVKAIQQAPIYSQQLAGRERLIIAVLMDSLDKRQAFKDPTQRVVHAAEVHLAFKDVEAGIVRLPDPTWQAWSRLAPPTDKRNLEGKVRGICPSVECEKVARWSRRAADSMIEQRALDDDKQVLALKYRLYDACEQRLAELRTDKPTLTSVELDAVVDDVLATAVKQFNIYSKQYQYKIVTEPSIRAMALEMIDSCYLGFDGKGV